MTTKLVFVAGPYSGANIITTLGNMRRGIDLATKAIKTGKIAVYAPWCDFLFGLVSPIDMQTYKQNSLAILDASDAVLLAPGWECSEGALVEIKRAQEIPIPVFEELEKLIEWADSQNCDCGCKCSSNWNI